MKGRTNNPNGRPKGSRNKVTAMLKAKVEDLLTDYMDNKEFQSDLKQLAPKDRLQIVTKLLDFALPRLKAVEHQDDSTKEYINIIDLGSGLAPDLEQFDDFTTEELKLIAEQLKLNQHGN